MKTEIILNELARLLEIDRDKLSMDFPLDGCHWDSLAIISMIATIDEHHNILLKGHELEKCNTINDLFLLIEIKNKNNAA